MLIDQANPEVVREVVEQYAALVEVSRTTATATNKTRNQLLQSLGPAELIAVSVELRRRGLLAVLPTVRVERAK
jgi:hypothetical protein